MNVLRNGYPKGNFYSSETYVWVLSGETFSVSDDPSDVPVGTTVSLQLKKAFAKEFTDTPIIRSKYHLPLFDC